MKKTGLLFWVLLALHGMLNAQQVQESAWFASFNTFRLTNTLSLHAEFQLRTTDNAAHVQTLLPRVGLNFKVGKNQVVTAGYACIPNRFTVSAYSSLLAEHRLYQQYVVAQPLKGGSGIQHRFRFEERWVPRAVLDGSDVIKQGTRFSTRFRYFVRGVFPLQKQTGGFKKGWFGALQNEVFLHTTNKENTNGKLFDQNRAYLAFGYRVSPRLDLETGYLNQYIQARNSLPNVVNHVWQVAVYTRL